MNFSRAFITGGASGLGLALARRLAADGCRVCIGDVNDTAGRSAVQELNKITPGAHFLHCDVTSDRDLELAACWLDSQWSGVDLVVNNAGVAQSGSLVDTPEEHWCWIIDINLMGVVRGCRAFVPLLQRSGGGTLLNVASMAGMVHLPGASAYNATKAAVIALSETLELELEADGIRVCVACPSFFRSTLARHMRSADEGAAAVTQRLVERARVSSDDVAVRIVQGLRRGDTHILTHGDATRAWRMKRWLPHQLWLRMLRGQLTKMNARMARKATQT